MKYTDIFTDNRSQLFGHVYINSENNKDFEGRDLQETLKSIVKHVVREYENENVTVKFKLAHSTPSFSNVFQLQSKNDDGRFYRVRCVGNSKSLMFLVSLLHEVGHMIDAEKRGYHVLTDQSSYEMVKCEVEAWKLGLRFGLVFGYLTKNEVLATWNEIMICLGSYHRDHGKTLDELESAGEEIKRFIEL